MNKFTPFNQKLFGWLSALVIAALIFSVGVVAAQNGFDPEDAIMNLIDPAAPPDSSTTNAVTAAASAGGVLTVFQTVATYNGAGPAGYGRTGMHDACRAEDSTSHFCTLQEIETAWKTGGVNFVLSSQAWVDNAVVGTINSDFTGDVQLFSDWYGGSANGDYPYNCNAWTVSTNTARGLILNSGVISPATEACDDIHPVACCK